MYCVITILIKVYARANISARGTKRDKSSGVLVRNVTLIAFVPPKLSVEEGNKGRRAQFKENFHRNFGRMDDWLEKLLTDHTAFCTNLRSALGEQQDHKISELTAMSEHLTSQVQMFTTMLHDMERQSAEAMRQAQYWVHSHLEGVRATTGASAEALRNSLMDLILPPMEGIMMQLQKSQTNLQEMSIKVNDLVWRILFVKSLFFLDIFMLVNEKLEYL
ncbi:hypothetical protein J437_LFUL005917 [Ladona fulva]|uniref:Uncharacterized protein n=1 Tax=Ladona fulva TaxID=123851 RepID=A0A8K0P3R3_LADFU|nr:hypothetical protein J437_LFUL005917 [Ladona fulva]